MIEKNNGERVTVYIDLENVEKGMNTTNGNLAVDYKELVEQLAGDRTLVAVYVFDACNGDESRLRRMRRITKNPRFRPIVLPYDPIKTIQKGVDVKMSIMMCDEALKDRYDTVIVVSGDADFIPAIEYVHATGKNAEVAAFICTASEDIRSVADFFTEIDGMNIFCLRGQSGKAPAYPQTKTVEATA